MPNVDRDTIARYMIEMHLGTTEVSDVEWQSGSTSVRVRRLVSDVKTRMWSVVDISLLQVTTPPDERV